MRVQNFGSWSPTWSATVATCSAWSTRSSRATSGGPPATRSSSRRARPSSSRWAWSRPPTSRPATWCGCPRRTRCTTRPTPRTWPSCGAGWRPTPQRPPGRPQRHAPVQQPGPLDVHGHAHGREHPHRRRPRHLGRQRRGGVPRGGRARRRLRWRHRPGRPDPPAADAVRPLSRCSRGHQGHCRAHRQRRVHRHLEARVPERGQRRQQLGRPTTTRNRPRRRVGAPDQQHRAHQRGHGHHRVQKALAAASRADRVPSDTMGAPKSSATSSPSASLSSVMRPLLTVRRSVVPGSSRCSAGAEMFSDWRRVSYSGRRSPSPV